MVSMLKSKRSLGLAAVVLAGIGVALAAPSAEAGVRVAVGIGVPVYAAPPVVVAPAPIYAAPPVVYAPGYYAPGYYGPGVAVGVGGYWGYDRFGHRYWHRR